jgi:hypothetical protein
MVGFVAIDFIHHTDVVWVKKNVPRGNSVRVAFKAGSYFLRKIKNKQRKIVVVSTVKMHDT